PHTPQTYTLSLHDALPISMDAKAKGDKPRALSALQRLETLYPASPLAESATVERMKILASTNPKSAAVLAKRYLAHYPDGFAREDRKSTRLNSSHDQISYA